MIIEGSDTHLHESCDLSGFHQPGKRAGVAKWIAFEILIEIGVRIEMQDRQAFVTGSMRHYQRVGDGVIAADGNEPIIAANSFRGPTIDRVIGCLAFQPGQLKIAAISQHGMIAKIKPCLTKHVRAVAGNGGAHQRRSKCGPAQEARVGVVWNAKKFNRHAFPLASLREAGKLDREVEGMGY